MPFFRGSQLLVTVPRRARFFHLRRIRQLRRYVDRDTLYGIPYTLIRALILSRLDYCNSLFACSSQSTLHRLQRVQDAVAGLLCGASARTHASLLMQLHWLLVSNCVYSRVANRPEIFRIVFSGQRNIRKK